MWMLLPLEQTLDLEAGGFVHALMKTGNAQNSD